MTPYNFGKLAADPRAMVPAGESGAAHPLNAINAANQTIKHYSKAYNQGNQPAVQNYAKQHQSLMQGASAANKQIGGPAIPTNPLPSTIAPVLGKAGSVLASFGAKVAQSTCSPCDMPNGPANKKHMTGASPAVTEAGEHSEELGTPEVAETEHSDAKAKMPEEGVKSAYAFGYMLGR